MLRSDPTIPEVALVQARQAEESKADAAVGENRGSAQDRALYGARQSFNSFKCPAFAAFFTYARSAVSMVPRRWMASA